MTRSLGDLPRRISFATLNTLACLWLLAGTLLADGKGDNRTDQVRPVPPPGITVPAEKRTRLEARITELGTAIDGLEGRGDPLIYGLLPDVRIYQKAVRDALKHDEFFSPQDIDRAESLLAEGIERSTQLEQKRAPWTTATGLVVRGYVSRIDGSVQPYGLVVPESYEAKGKDRYRLDVWFHGRGETLSEVNFLDDRRKKPGVFTPADTLVLHPYGRYCNAYKFAGEVDVLEALESVKARYRIDEDRIGVRGFSMGGAACWQFAVHYADRWFAANPGAGFSETPRFLESFQKETLRPAWYEKALWQLYDCPDVSGNLLQCPTVAYSGEIDIQKQAADVMAEALKKQGINLVHVIGPGTGHQYHPAARDEVERRMNRLAARGRIRVPRSLVLETSTLKYNRMNWLTIDGLGEHWKPARVKARLMDDDPRIVVSECENVTELALDFGPGDWPFDASRAPQVDLPGVTLTGPSVNSDGSWNCRVHREGTAWMPGPLRIEGNRKRHDLQGPIDDAFMDSFIFVMPTGPVSNGAVKEWVDRESRRAVSAWRSQFRGDARVKNDVDISEADIAGSNLVLWGDPSSNSLMKRVAGKLPIGWTDEAIMVVDQRYDPAHHVLTLVYPNPINPSRYVVFNSGFTFREYDYLNNARQVPRLPDWAIIDIRTPPDPRSPGKIATADFFGESWEYKATRKQ